MRRDRAHNLNPVVRTALVSVMLLAGAFAPAIALADEPAPAPPSAETVAPSSSVDPATLEALGIREPAVDAVRTGRPVSPNAGPWSWSTGAYQYDPSGNIKAIGTQSFLYDLQGRLVDARLTRPDQPGAELRRVYTYDPYGNMTAEWNGSGTTAMTTSQATNHLTSMSAVYDAAGNVTQLHPPGQTVTYEYQYDALNALQEAKAANVAGTPRQLHIYTASDERLWTYDLETGVSHWKIRDMAGKVQRDYVVTGTTWQVDRDYIYRDGLLLAAVTPTGTLYYSLDHLGTPRVITDGNRERKGFHHYLPFGQEWTDASGTQEGEVLKFTGHERDRAPAAGADGLDYMHARYYEAKMGRFLSVDRVQGNPSGPQSWNRYSYARNNPIRRADPDGNADVDFYVLMDPAARNAAYDRQWFADRLADQYGGVAGHNLRVSTDTRNSIANMRTSFGREGGLV